MIPMMMRLLRKSLQKSVGQAVQPEQAASCARLQVPASAQAQPLQPADALCIWLHLHK